MPRDKRIGRLRRIEGEPGMKRTGAWATKDDRFVIRWCAPSSKPSAAYPDGCVRLWDRNDNSVSFHRSVSAATEEITRRLDAEGVVWYDARKKEPDGLLTREECEWLAETAENGANDHGGSGSGDVRPLVGAKGRKLWGLMRELAALRQDKELEDLLARSIAAAGGGGIAT